MRLLSAERMFAFIIAAIAIVDLVLIVLKGVSVDWAGYSVPFFGSMLLIAGGQYYSIHRGEKRLALALTASGLFIIFTLVASVFNYLLLPIRFPVLDTFWVRLDAKIGYDWPSFVMWIAQWPILAKILLLVYFSSLPQLVLVILILAFTDNAKALWHFLLTGAIAVLICIGVWFFFPSFGASAVHGLPQHILDIVQIPVDPKYSREVLRLAGEGPGYISPTNALGLIGFPSFHSVMACMSVIFLARTKWIFPFAALLNLMMIPAILIHGGHHLSDVFGGVFTFVAAYFLAGKLLSLLPAVKNQWQSIRNIVAN